MTNSENLPLIISIFSAAVACTAAGIAFKAMRNQRFISKWISNYGRMIDGEKLLLTNPDLLKLHGVTQADLTAANATPAEVVYLLVSFRGAQESYRLDPKGEGPLSPYRLQMLSSPKVARIWNEILSKYFIFRGAFVQLVKAHLKGHPELLSPPLIKCQQCSRQFDSATPSNH